MKRAVCIGINYKGENRLEGCVNDMNDWSGELNQHRRFDQITQLQDQFATRQAILSTLEYEVQQQTRKDDLLVVTFSGHGTWLPDSQDPSGRDEAICPWDILTDGAKALIIDKELFKIFKEARGRVVVISDSCHSGTVTRLLAPLAGASIERTPRFISPVQFMPKDQNNPDMLTPHDYSALKVLGTRPPSKALKYSTLLMSGCKDNEYSYDAVFNGRPNGAFTYVALRELKKMDAAGYKPSYLEWYKAIRKLLPSQSAPQRPQIDGEWGWKANWKVFE